MSFHWSSSRNNRGTCTQTSAVKNQIPSNTADKIWVTPTQKWPTPGCFSTTLTRHYKRDTFQYQQITLSQQWQCESVCGVFSSLKASKLSQRDTTITLANGMIGFYNYRYRFKELHLWFPVRFHIWKQIMNILRQLVRPTVLCYSERCITLTQNNSDRWLVIICVSNVSRSHKDGAGSQQYGYLSALSVFIYTEWGQGSQ